jgi:hypothetical protein
MTKTVWKEGGANKKSKEVNKEKLLVHEVLTEFWWIRSGGT